MSGSPGRRPDPYAPFRPRYGRWTAIVVGSLVLVGCVVVASAAHGQMATTGNRASLVVFGLVVVLILWRVGGVRADVDREGITVRNVARTERYEWTQVVAVRFGADQPWLRLDLSDGQTVAVVAVQQADGDRARAEAGRLAALAQAHGEGVDPADRNA
ncbi:PH domain-containing protein [Cellulomonas sp. PhB143]|uniref:PH domain-containing protein n=1 Tax=Cellulomonas sp. PhB143 TaxID=2485186 RepID=UPI000F4AE640|nr:PH domain-containing protein [Cellulomonas sp. PhB143]ROS74511.1 PH (Pleckstrin Homology) domain-containing protein [Cellulomonas sp. PhB143]